MISDEQTGEVVAQIFPAGEMHSIDDFDVDGNLIFALDSRGRNYVAVYSFDGQEVKIVNDPIQVQGGPFNGIAAAQGNLVISGGTTFLERFTYSNGGKIDGPVRFGRDRGHPDIILSNDGQAAFVSTDFGIGLDIERFGIMSLFIGDELQIPYVISELGIEASGFTPGLTTPTGFPIQSVQVSDRLFVAHGGGVTAIDLEQNVFANSQELDLEINSTAIDATTSTVYVVGLMNEIPTLLTLDISDTQNTVVANSFELDVNGEVPTAIAIGSNDIYVAVGRAGIISLPIQ